MELLEIYNDDCFNIFPKIKDNSIDLFILDLPYGQTACAWDTPIDLDKMWIEIKRMMKKSAIICFFCNTKFGFTLIESNPKWFKYDLIWKKSRKVGFLSANKRQLRNHENVYVFNNDNNDDIEIKRNIELRKYAEKVKEYINKPLKQINKDMKNRKADHFFYINSSQFGLLTEETYKKLIELYKIDKMKGFLKYKDMVEKWEKEPSTTYNPQKTEGTPYKPNRKTETNVYGTIKLTNDENKGDRHPASIIEHENTILEYNSVHKTIHRTEKPVGLLEYLIKTYSNEGDVVMDFTMGSGSCGEACLKTKRRFVGVEMDDEIFVLAQDRLATQSQFQCSLCH